MIQYCPDTCLKNTQSRAMRYNSIFFVFFQSENRKFDDFFLYLNGKTEFFLKNKHYVLLYLQSNSENEVKNECYGSPVTFTGQRCT